MIIKIALTSFPFMRTSLRAVNKFFQTTVDKNPYPSIYIPELEKRTTVISVQKLIRLKGKGSGLRSRIRINSPRWNKAWIKIVPESHGWFIVTGIYWKRHR